MSQNQQNRSELRKLCTDIYLLNQLARFRAINLAAHGESFTPFVGVFWMDLAESKIYSAKTPLGDAEDYGDFKVHSTGHYDNWPQIVLLNPKWKGMEYEDVPRGRVVFHRNKKQSKFLIYLCPFCSGNTGIMSEIIDEFRLPEGFFEFRFDDEHYVISDEMQADIEPVGEISETAVDFCMEEEDSYYDIPITENLKNSEANTKI